MPGRANVARHLSHHSRSAAGVPAASSGDSGVLAHASCTGAALVLRLSRRLGLGAPLPPPVAVSTLLLTPAGLASPSSSAVPSLRACLRARRPAGVIR